MSVIIKCPACDKKLKMQEPTPGKKVRCPACKEPFVPVSAAGGGTKKKAAPKKKPAAPADEEYFDDDDYGDDYGDDDYAEQQPKSKRAAPAAAGKGKTAKASASKKKSASKNKSKAPLFIGVAVLAVGLASGLTYMLWPDGGDATGSTVVDAGDGATGDGGSTAPASNDEAAMMASVNSGEHGASPGGGDAEHGGGSASSPAAAANLSSTGSAGMSNMSAPAVENNYSQSGPVDLTYLPSQTEAVVKIDAGRLLDGPLGQLLQIPEIAGPLQQFEQGAGMGPKDIESITLGIGGITDAISSGSPPQPDKFPVVAVIRLKVPIDNSKLQALIPNGESVTEGSMTFVRIPEDPPTGVWLADSNTVIFGLEPWVKENGRNPTKPTNIDNELFDGTSPIQVLFSPANADAVFRHPNAQIPPQVAGPPAAMAVARSFLSTARGAFIGIDLTNDLGFNFSVRCKDSAAAVQMVADMNAAQAESKAMAANQPANPMMAPFMNIQKAMEESQKIEVSGDICRISSSAKGGGQQLAGFMPLAMMMIGPAMQQARTAARRTESGNNLKQIGLAMHNFESLYGRFPNAASLAPSGQRLLSWRVHLLPFLGQNELYEQFALDQPWDSDANKALIAKMPNIYKSPQTPLEPGKTIFQVPVSAGAAFEEYQGRGLRDFTDGTSNTILVVEAAPDRAVVWTQPEDFELNASSPKTGLGMNAQGVSQAILADGSVRVISAATTDSALKSMFTRNGAD